MRIIFENYTKNVYEELNALHSDEEWRNKFIVLFGMNNSSEVQLKYFADKSIKVAGFADNDITKQGMSYMGVKVYSPQKLLGEYKENAFILIASSAWAAMKRQLQSMGYQEEQIYRLKSFDINNAIPFNKDSDYEYTELSLREIQLASLDVMLHIKKFCESRGIRYYLAYGSLIGAVRHKGFIPWDDDIDILMPWNDYIRFCNEFVNDDEFEIFSMYGHNEEQPICNQPITKILNKKTVTEMFNFPIHTRRGVCVDIFPMSGYPDSEEDRTAYDLELKELARYWKRNVVNYIGTEEYNIDKHLREWKKLENVMTRYSYDESEYVGSVACAPYNHSIAPRNKYEMPSKVIFEGYEFDAPGDVDFVLTETYGDYMKLPPEEQRNPKHFFRTYKIEKKL